MSDLLGQLPPMEQRMSKSGAHVAKSKMPNKHLRVANNHCEITTEALTNQALVSELEIGIAN